MEQMTSKSSRRNTNSHHSPTRCSAIVRAAVRWAFLTLVVSIVASPVVAATHVVDGDTVVIDGEKIRIYNIDAPELGHARCDAERRLAEVAKRRLDALLSSGPVVIVRGDDGRMRDRYGRTLARLAVDGHDIGEILIREELARPWEGKRQPWCGG